MNVCNFNFHNAMPKSSRILACYNKENHQNAQGYRQTYLLTPCCCNCVFVNVCKTISTTPCKQANKIYSCYNKNKHHDNISAPKAQTTRAPRGVGKHIYLRHTKAQISDFRFQISDFGFQISDFRFQISDFRFQIWISDFEI